MLAKISLNCLRMLMALLPNIVAAVSGSGGFTGGSSGGSGGGGGGGSSGSGSGDDAQSHPMRLWTFLYAALLAGKLLKACWVSSWLW